MPSVASARISIEVPNIVRTAVSVSSFVHGILKHHETSQQFQPRSVEYSQAVSPQALWTMWMRQWRQPERRSNAIMVPTGLAPRGSSELDT